MKWMVGGASLLIVALTWFACDAERKPVAVATHVGSLADLTTEIPIDIGALHNDATRIFQKRQPRGFGMTPDQFIPQAMHAFNKALERYGQSRDVTTEDCTQAMQILMVEVQPYFDVFLQDSTMLDPSVLLNHWEQERIVSTEEIDQIRAMLRGAFVFPISNLIREATALHSASTVYWYGKTPGPWLDGSGDAPDKEHLKSFIDFVGGIVGHYGVGGIGSLLCGYLASNSYSIYENPTWLGGGAGANGEMITGYGRGPIY